MVARVVYLWLSFSNRDFEKTSWMGYRRARRLLVRRRRAGDTCWLEFRGGAPSDPRLRLKNARQ